MWLYQGAAIVKDSSLAMLFSVNIHEYDFVPPFYSKSPKDSFDSVLRKNSGNKKPVLKNTEPLQILKLWVINYYRT